MRQPEYPNDRTSGPFEKLGKVGPRLASQGHFHFSFADYRKQPTAVHWGRCACGTTTIAARHRLSRRIPIATWKS